MLSTVSNPHFLGIIHKIFKISHGNILSLRGFLAGRENTVKHYGYNNRARFGFPIAPAISEGTGRYLQYIEPVPRPGTVRRIETIPIAQGVGVTVECQP